ncbi:DUF3137 domain-containing protein [Sulfurospirillum sp. 1307]|jgi:hypothetical protein
MKKLSELQDFFYEEIFPDLKFLEKKRLEIYSSLKFAALVFAVIALVVYIYLKDYFDPINFLFFIVAIFSSFFGFFYKYKVAGFSSLYKDFVIERLVSFVDSSLRYNKNGLIPKYEYISSNLFTDKIDRFNGDDLVAGKIDGVDIRFCELHHQVKVKTQKGQTHYKTIFQGLFFTANFNKNFKGKTIILPDRSEKIFGNISHIFQSISTKGELVKLDNPEFEREFVVYSSDQIEARYILSHSLMQSILDLKKLIGKNLHISFINSKIYIAIDFNKQLFEPKVYKKLTDFSEIKFYFQVISIAVEIVKILNLDRKIWSKR